MLQPWLPPVSYAAMGVGEFILYDACFKLVRGLVQASFPTEDKDSLLNIFSASKPESWALDVTVKPSSVEIKNGEDCRMLNLPPEVRIVPSSCRGLQYVPGDGLHMRLLIRAGLNTKSILALEDSLKSKKSCTFYCQSCGESIIKDRTFLRVLSLPGENWSDLVEEWCCHPNPFNSRLLHPQNDDCFLGHNYFLVNSGSESTLSSSERLHSQSQGAASGNSGSILNPKANSRVICKRCKTFLGEAVSPGVTKYYFTELLVQSSEESFNAIPRSLFIQSIVAQCLLELSSVRSTFRFRIQGTEGTIYILVWLLNSDTLLAESSGNSTSNNGFTFFEHGVMSNSEPSEIRNAIKVLYHPCLKRRNKDLVDAWENDFGVHPLTFPSKTCLQLILILAQSNASLPPSLRCMNPFEVAFLKM
ncbi:PREDICTED: E3 ubiquitin-protein ligase E3D [Gekko japonicus]|uniref:E3 ubiquitin-protein ligase E3D n=1 Tax=Gekko japonicus TaxID=146911 RepID=A0ABM1K3K7_GEKJA|nr:PREDICTED: E3 ubiquitin-protein ligase E3D [Gekko japonicus]